MKLETHLSKHGKSQTDFARELSEASGQSIGACAVIISRIINEDHIPRSETVELICKLARGEVQPNDFYDLSKIKKAAQ